MHPPTTVRLVASATLIAIIQMAMMACVWVAFAPIADAYCLAAVYTVLSPPLFLFLLACVLRHLGVRRDVVKHVDELGGGLSLCGLLKPVSSIASATSSLVGDGALTGVLRPLASVWFGLRSSSSWAAMMQRFLSAAEAYADFVCRSTAEQHESLGRRLASVKKQHCEQMAKLDSLNEQCLEISRKARGSRGACRHDLSKEYGFFAALCSFEVVAHVKPEEGPIARSFTTVVNRLAHQADMSLWWMMTGISRVHAAIAVNQSLIDSLSQVLGQKANHYRIIAEHIESCNGAQDSRPRALSWAPPAEPNAPVVARAKRSELAEGASTAERIWFNRSRKVWSAPVLPITETALTPLTPVEDEATSLAGPEPPVPEAIESPVQDTDYAPTTLPPRAVSRGSLPEGPDQEANLTGWLAENSRAAEEAEASEAVILRAAYKQLQWTRTVLAPQQRRWADELRRLAIDGLWRVIERGQARRREQEERKQRLLLKGALGTEEDRRRLDVQEQLRCARKRTAKLKQKADARQSKVDALREALCAAEAELRAAEDEAESAQAEEDYLRRLLSQPANDDDASAPESAEEETSEIVTQAQQCTPERPLPQKVDDETSSEEESTEEADLGGSDEPETEGALVPVTDDRDEDLSCQLVPESIRPTIPESNTTAATTDEVVTEEGVPASLEVEAIFADTSMISAPEMEAAPTDITMTADEDVAIPAGQPVQDASEMAVDHEGDFEHLDTEAHADVSMQSAPEMEEVSTGEVQARDLYEGVDVQSSNFTFVEEQMLDAPELRILEDNVVNEAGSFNFSIDPLDYQVAGFDQQRRVEDQTDLEMELEVMLLQAFEQDLRSEIQAEAISQPDQELVVVPSVEDAVMEESALINNRTQAATGAIAEVTMLCADDTQAGELDAAPFGATEGESSQNTEHASAREVIHEVSQDVEGACGPMAPNYQEPEADAEGEAAGQMTNCEELEANAEGDVVSISSPAQEPEAHADDGDGGEPASEVAITARLPAPEQQVTSGTPAESEDEAPPAPSFRPAFRRPRLRMTAEERAKALQEFQEIEAHRLRSTLDLQASVAPTESAEGSSDLREAAAEDRTGKSEMGEVPLVDGEGDAEEQPETDVDGEPETNVDGESDNESEEESEDDEDEPEPTDDDQSSHEDDDDSNGGPPPLNDNTDGDDSVEPYDPNNDHHPSDDDSEEPDMEDEWGSLVAARKANPAQQRQQAVEEARRRTEQRRAAAALEANRLRREEEEARKRQRAQEHAARCASFAAKTSVTQTPKKRGLGAVYSDSSDADNDDQADMDTDDRDVRVVRDSRVADKRAITEQKTQEEKKVVAAFEDHIPGSILRNATTPGFRTPGVQFNASYGPDSFSTHARRSNPLGGSHQHLDEVYGSAAEYLSRSRASNSPPPQRAVPASTTPVPEPTTGHQNLDVAAPQLDDARKSFVSFRSPVQPGKPHPFDEQLKELEAQERQKKGSQAPAHQGSSSSSAAPKPRQQPPPGQRPKMMMARRSANPFGQTQRTKKKPAMAQPQKPPDDDHGVN
ncbi:hypothetical protein QBC42DRAFT_254911 [Cladorrhinum samala]|uniref:Uncharacterized protein n=1 Tax=Cladorrhinum samala TaxID=585594 RepID=A0AAV9HDY3_9PEZI|nr:hypothetical protein QBC42DRAFT_254911 [Cladorrhinum samala]